MIYTVKGFGIVNKAEIDVFLELSCLFDDTEVVGNLISGSSAFSKSSLNIWKFTVHILLNPGLESFQHCFASMWDECNCAVVWAFFGIAFLWNWNENWPFPVLWPLLSFLYIMLVLLFGDLPPLNNICQLLAVLDEHLISAITTSLLLLLHHILAVENSNANLILSPLWVIYLFPVEAFRILSSLLWFWNFTVMYKILMNKCFRFS